MVGKRDFMKPKIIVLSDHTINKIAAGEVIENPASLVKELIENSLDAKATKIVIEVMGGGLQKIIISDNGSGMGPEDAVLSLQRHATSKIKDDSDLVDINTMGFRGEALASASAVSKMTLQTADETGRGTLVEAEAGKILHVSPCARMQGTTIEIRNLFYNVPARKKFQKSPSFCLADITKTVTALGLAHPFVSFELYSAEESILKLKDPGAVSFLEAIKIRSKEVLGDEFLEDHIALEGDFASFSCTGLLGSFQNTRPNRSLQYQFLNNRSVLCPAVSFAVKDAFGTRIEEKRFPVYVLHLTIPKEFIDVNVHPQKKEVRLQNEAFFKEALRKKIEEHLVPSSCFNHTTSAYPLFSEESFFAKPKTSYEEPVREFLFKEAPREEKQLEFAFDMQPEIIGLYEHFLWVDAASIALEGVPEEGLLWIDLKKAESRILFDALQKKGKASEKQLLFFPLTLSCSAHEAQKIEAGLEEIDALGFTLGKSRNGFLIEAIPPSLGEGEALDFLKDYLYSEEKDSFVTSRNERKLASACSAISSRRKKPYSQSEASAIFKNLLKTSSPKLCPMGDTILTSLGKDELQRLFRKK